MLSVESQLKFLRNMSLPSSGPKPASASCPLHADYLLGLLFSCEDGDDMLFLNVGRLSTEYMA
jgi:hypothetical protein